MDARVPEAQDARRTATLRATTLPRAVSRTGCAPTVNRLAMAHAMHFPLSAFVGARLRLQGCRSVAKGRVPKSIGRYTAGRPQAGSYKIPRTAMVRLGVWRGVRRR